LNILQITPRLPYPPNDGGAVYIYYNTKYLSQLGNHVTIVSFISNKHEQDAGPLKVHALVHPIDGNFSPYSLSSVFKSTLSRKPVTIQHRMRPGIMRKALNEVETQPDVILLEGLHTAAFIDDLEVLFPKSPIVLRQSNVEYLLLKRNATVTKNPFIKAFYYDQYRLMKRFELTAMKRVDAVTAITEYDKEIYLKDLPNLNVFVNPAGAEIPDSLGIQRKEDHILAISNWRWKPNFDGLKWFLETVWPNFIEKKPYAKLLIAGEGLEDDFIEKYNHSQIQFLGFVDDLEPLRQSASVFIAPLFSGSGMKLKIIEGMASGLPIITTKIGAEGIEIEHNYHYYQANSKAEFEDAILSLLDNQKKREKMSEAAQQIVKERYSWNSITLGLIQFLQTVQKK
jgi:glycosyltransferase involved in cell wall biosynthesis